MDQPWTPYCGSAPQPADWLWRWESGPAAPRGLAFITLWGWWRVPRRLPFLAATSLAVLLFVSPLCALSSALFSVRVAHHLVLTTILAPLLAWSVVEDRSWGSAPAWAAGHAVLFWLWHAPQPYASALSSDAFYWLMQASLLLSATGFWASLRRTPIPLGLALLLGLMVQMGLLGALITFSAAPLYAPHLGTTSAWGLSPLEDQQLAGLIMWAPGSAFYLLAALTLGWQALSPSLRAAR